jgi:hypothetical protein
MMINLPALFAALKGGNVNNVSNGLPLPGVNTNDPGNAATSTSGIPALLRSVIGDTANNVQPPVPSIDTTSADASNNAAVGNAVSSMQPPLPQLSTRTGIMDGPTPQAGQPYAPLSMLGKIARVAGIAGNVAQRLAPYVGEGKRQQEAGEFQEQQDLASQRQAAAESQQNFERGIQTDANQRANTLLPGEMTLQRLRAAAGQQAVDNYQTPEQQEQMKVKYAPLLVPNKMTGQLSVYDPSTGSFKPATNADGTPFNEGSSVQRYTPVFNDKQIVGIKDAGTGRFLTDPTSMPADAKSLYDAASHTYQQQLHDQRQTQSIGINAAADRQDKTFQQQRDMYGQRHDDAVTKQLQPYQAIVDEAQNAHTAADMANHGNASADVDLALSFFKAMKGGNGSGIRFTQQEQKMITGARNSSQDLLAIGQKVIGSGQPLTPQQRQNMLDVIDLNAGAARSAMQRLGGNVNAGNVNANVNAPTSSSFFTQFGGTSR